MECIPYQDCSGCEEEGSCCVIHELERKAAGLPPSCILCGTPGTDGTCATCTVRYSQPY